jgi:carotenoid phi-ring synthase / carotenoid chi-ring synthase
VVLQPLVGAAIGEDEFMATLIGHRDRRAHCVTAPLVGQQHRLRADQSLNVTVVGGGLAGATAALVLAERGARVTLHEAEPVLGGRLSSWPDTLSAAAGGGEFQMERGFHAFFRQYYNLRNLLRRFDPELRSLRPCTDYPLYGPNGAMESFAGLPRRPPLNLLALIKRTPTIGWRDLRSIDGEWASEMLAFDPVDSYARFDSMSAASYLDRVRFPEQARMMLFEVFAHSFFNPQESMSAAEMLMMFHLYFCGSAEGILFDVLDEPFDVAVWQPLARLLREHGVVVHTNSCVTSLDEPGHDEAVVLAVTVEALQSIVAANAWMARDTDGSVWCDDVMSLRQAPPFAVLRLWLDQPVARDRAPFAGTAGMGIIDNISVVGRYQGEARAWEQRHGGSIVELHGYALTGERDQRETRAELLRWLHHVYPETANARILDERLILRRDCPAFEPNSYARRPTLTTPHPRVVLAGDLVKLPFPTALMERATTSAMLAANEILRVHSVSPEPVWSIPVRGVLAGLQQWKRTMAEKRSS